MIANIINDGFYAIGNGGIVFDRVNDFDFIEISKEVEEIRKDFEKAEKANDTLIGQLEQEYNLKKSIDVIEKNALRLANYYNTHTQYSSNKLGILEKNQRSDCEFVLDSCWVNFQKKYEFQPMHDHTGVYSFILFYEIPYEIQKEFKVSPGKNSKEHYAGLLDFHYVSYLGNIGSVSVPADRKWQKRMLLFPAELNHSVYPFYSSDDYRITISGNLSISHTGEKNGNI